MNAMYNRQTIWVLVMIIVAVAGCRIPDTENPVFRTISNPLNLNYRFCLDDVSHHSYDTDAIYKTDNLRYGVWKTIACSFPLEMLEPMFFSDEGRLYLYAGVGNSVSYGNR